MSIVAALVLLAMGATGKLPRGSAILAALPFLSAFLLAIYVFSEDTYRRNGTSRWDAYRSPGGALGPMFVLSLALLAVYGAALAYSSLRGRRRLFQAAALSAGLTELFLVIPTILGFSLN